MIDTAFLAYLFCFFALVIILFQLALALGAPWGELTMGGQYPGRLPVKMRVAALCQLVLIVLAAIIVLIRAAVVASDLFEISRSAIWFVVALFFLSAILNIITPSKKERMMGAPIAIILFASSLLVASS